MDNYECSIKALKIPFIPLGIRSPAGDVLKAVSKLNGQVGRSSLLNLKERLRLKFFLNLYDYLLSELIRIKSPQFPLFLKAYLPFYPVIPFSQSTSLWSHGSLYQ